MPRGAIPPSPFPQHQGVDAVRIKLPGAARADDPLWPTIRDYLHFKLPISPALIDDMIGRGEFVHADAQPVRLADPYVVGYIWVNRPFAPETPAPEPIMVLHQDEYLVVIDKPHFIASNPQGAHLTQTAQALSRVATGIPTLCIAHRLDRITAGVMMLTVRPDRRGPYQELFAHGRAHKTYLAVVKVQADLATCPLERSSYIEKRHESLQAFEFTDRAPNARTTFEVLAVDDANQRAVIRARPLTGRTHQIRIHLAALGLPIVNDPLYPVPTDAVGNLTDFSRPLQLLAESLSFVDPVTGQPRAFASRRRLSHDWRSGPAEQAGALDDAPGAG